MAETYGLKVLDAGGTGCVITPDMGTVISMGRVTMPSALVDTDKYYASIDLPGTSAVAVADLTVLAIPVIWHHTDFPVYVMSVGWGQYDVAGNFLDSAETYYTKVESTGVMTSYTAGDLTSADATEWDTVINGFPIVYWEQLGATTVTDIKIFAATCYAFTTAPDSSAPILYSESNKFAYSIYTSGVETVDYMILNKKWNY